jgi:preprotein translocase subunit SecF
MFVILYRNIFLTISAVLILGSIIIIGVFGLKLGIDFTGGSLTEVVYNTALPDKAELEGLVGNLDIGTFTVRESNDEVGRDGYLIRTKSLTEEERVSLEGATLSLGEGGEVTRFTSIGPVIGQELKDKSVWAIGGVVMIIVLYVAFAFSGIGKPVSSWIYGGITILVLAHDVLIPAAMISLLGYFAGVEIDTLFVMAILAVLGYSVNDTLVIFDRVRENLIKNRTERKIKQNVAGMIKEEIEYTITKPFDEIVGEAVKDTMARSINTSFTTLLTLTALYFIGGTVTQTFALVLMAGVIAGTYSSIFFANPLLVAYAKWQEKKLVK